MAKNKNQKQPAKQQPRSQDPTKGTSETESMPSSSAPSPMDMAHKRKEKKFGHN
ncbi:hypothetical protein OG373_28250 [Streptomyces avidinii]|uniref:hypothetical protein n=1 Tax=Streptomyces TaxID=1883 RepID=UPI000AACF984|nr:MULTISPECIES: hypothetical protein [Streptomyces]WST47898.1 hypothetical protein OG592_28855 [Streptomyces avidinii]WTA99941.1 hypothetical protein OG373_28250 [Streptomyces avidinii]